MATPLFPEHLLPVDASAKTHSLQALAALQQRFAGAAIPFDEMMHFLLYDDDIGYYTRKSDVFGPAGDFVTAPTRGPIFGRCLGQWLSEISPALQVSAGGAWALVEWGGGDGQLLASLLPQLSVLGCPPQEIHVLDISPLRKQKQLALLQRECPAWLEKIRWHAQWPTLTLPTIVIANELLDALPVCLFTITEPDGIVEKAVTIVQDQLQWQTVPARAAVSAAVRAAEAALGYALPVGYTSEICLQYPALISQLQTALLHPQKLILFVDYGYPQHEYFHLQRSMGTLMCHFRQHAHGDPLVLPGIQDITAHVNFTAVADAAQRHGLDVLGFTNQTAFLLDCGIEQFHHDAITSFAQQQQQALELKQLLLADTMGAAFKVLALGQGMTESESALGSSSSTHPNLSPRPTPGFRIKDFTHRL